MTKSLGLCFSFPFPFASDFLLRRCFYLPLPIFIFNVRIASQNIYIILLLFAVSSLIPFNLLSFACRLHTNYRVCRRFFRLKPFLFFFNFSIFFRFPQFIFSNEDISIFLIKIFCVSTSNADYLHSICPFVCMFHFSTEIRIFSAFYAMQGERY